MSICVDVDYPYVSSRFISIVEVIKNYDVNTMENAFNELIFLESQQIMTSNRRFTRESFEEHFDVKCYSWFTLA